MATRSQVKAWIRSYLGTSVDDPLYGDATPGASPTLDPIVQQAIDGLIEEIYQAVPAYAPKIAILAAADPTSHLYPFATQTPPITDFSHWLKVRFDDENGAGLDECRWEELTTFGLGYFAIVGADDQAVLETSLSTDAGHPLWIQYGFRPADLTNDADHIPLIPKKYHDVVALEALFAYELGGESVRPPALMQRWRDRRASLFARIGRRGTQQNRTRLDPSVLESYQ